MQVSDTQPLYSNASCVRNINSSCWS